MRVAVLAAAIALGSCSVQSPPPGPDPALARELAGRIPGPPQDCVSAASGESLRPIDPGTIAYGWGRTIYVNHLPAECPGVRPFNKLIVEVHGGQYCRLDRIRGAEPSAIIPSPSCALGDWVPYRRP